ncbi:MAG: hypothetical protein KDI30_13365 [Pseudomonadales bacterium]|nr:hypothetical protein [Pseudomonadales bacterium]
MLKSPLIILSLFILTNISVSQADENSQKKKIPVIAKYLEPLPLYFDYDCNAIIKMGQNAHLQGAELNQFLASLTVKEIYATLRSNLAYEKCPSPRHNEKLISEGYYASGLSENGIWYRNRTFVRQQEAANAALVEKVEFAPINVKDQKDLLERIKGERDAFIEENRDLVENALERNLQKSAEQLRKTLADYENRHQKTLNWQTEQIEKLKATLLEKEKAFAEVNGELRVKNAGCDLHQVFGSADNRNIAQGEGAASYIFSGICIRDEYELDTPFFGDEYTLTLPIIEQGSKYDVDITLLLDNGVTYVNRIEGPQGTYKDTKAMADKVFWSYFLKDPLTQRHVQHLKEVRVAKDDLNRAVFTRDSGIEQYKEEDRSFEKEYPAIKESQTRSHQYKIQRYEEQLAKLEQKVKAQEIVVADAVATQEKITKEKPLERIIPCHHLRDTYVLTNPKFADYGYCKK